ncbi:hypothetical protein D9M71_704930 [compost metagenome]
MVSRVEAQSAQITKAADLSSVVGGTQGVAAVLDQPQAVAVAQFAHHLEIERIA